MQIDSCVQDREADSGILQRTYTQTKVPVFLKHHHTKRNDTPWILSSPPKLSVEIPSEPLEPVAPRAY